MEARALFEEVIAVVAGALESEEWFACYLSGEASDFVRLNHNRVRQAGRVEQNYLSIDLGQGARHTEGSLPLSGDPDGDRSSVVALLQELRSQRAHVADDPYLHHPDTVRSTENVRPSSLPKPEDALETITEMADGLDLVGIWASGTLHRGFANASGQRNWFETANFNFDWSCYHHADKAAKCGYAGFDWSEDALRDRMGGVRRELEIVAHPPRSVPPGAYRAYLAPRALHDLLQMLGWNGFGLKSHRTGNSALVKMVKEDKRLDPRVTLVEDHAGGAAPPFTGEGFIKPDRVPLIEDGVYSGSLAPARSAKEYGEAVNAASEHPESLFMAPGELADGEVLERLDTGVYINNLWYCNFSDPNDCRMTGLTRFASFWVEDGKIEAPLAVMRFDDSVYRMFGEGLIALTDAPELIFDPGTYFERSTVVTRLPGALIEGFRFTL